MNLLPVSRRVFSELVSVELDDVKPMPGPKLGLVYMDFVYESEEKKREDKLKKRKETIKRILSHDKQ
jgi:hypothetical protein